MLRRLALIAWLLSASIGRADDPTRARAEPALQASEVPGVVVVVVNGERSVFVGGVGVRVLGKPDQVTDDTVFPFASCTKAMTATLIANLADEQVLSWDDPVRKHLPNFHLSDPTADAAVTLRDLMCHRTGV